VDDVSDGGRGGALRVIALIGGTGKLGSGLAARLARAGHDVVIGSRDPVRAEAAAHAVVDALSGEHVVRVRGAANDAAAAAAEVVVLAVPFDAQRVTVEGLAAAVGDRVVVSTAVPVDFVKGSSPVHVEVEEGSAAEQVAALLPGARVVGALHTVSSAKLGRLDRQLDGDVLVTGDDHPAKVVVADVLASLPALRPVDAGPLENSRHVERLAVLLLTINGRTRRNTGVQITNLPDDRAF
jgi:NADPH-dependent F420 reductase